jgi:CDGSH-type Zn-finger protein
MFRYLFVLPFLMALVVGIVLYKLFDLQHIAVDPIWVGYSTLVATYLLSRFVLAMQYTPPTISDPRPEFLPMVTVVIPGMNEEDVIERTIRAAVNSDYRRPWVMLDEGTLDEAIAAIEACPSGALRYERVDGGPQETPATPTTIVPWPNGPLMVRGEMEIRDARGNLFDASPRMTLCRCGDSKNHPFCDLSHREAGFKDYPRVTNEERAAAQAPDEVSPDQLS